MKILAVSDEECPALWDHFVPGRLDDYDIMISCGDLKASYLTFLVTMGRARLFYVHGNHDIGYSSQPPEGCEDIDGHLVVYRGLRILGLGGCLWYHPGPYQYTERQMKRQIASLRHAIKKAGGVDIVVTHAPPRGLGDLEDPAHRGFEAFVKLIEEFHPKYLLHGHTHLRYSANARRETEYLGTRVINVSERCVIDVDDPSPEVKKSDGLQWITRHRERLDLWNGPFD